MAAMVATTKLKAPSSASTIRSWSTKQYILLALGGTLAAAVVVIAISALLSPAEIDFSITKASHHPSQDGGVDLYLTVTAGNPGWRAAVEYRRFDVKLQYTPDNDSPTLINEDAGAPTLVRMPFVQPPRNTTAILVSVFISAEYWNEHLKGETKKNPISVQVTATVRFVIGKAFSTRSYDIAVSCNVGLALFDNATVLFNNGVNCDEAAGN
ncbi:hypothetical protein E2562_016259 [Oryza meyeriana var. granulata]|uniref:Uncharacterized protein n=1 Tax=Oryza meyeriana var. granulata TaxID=110450 RepID=A0A6G1CRG3_9ORYZ|nr:hypothetical protein E2562_016259 [Oryza meyeriana var. granulata]